MLDFKKIQDHPVWKSTSLTLYLKPNAQMIKFCSFKMITCCCFQAQVSKYYIPFDLEMLHRFSKKLKKFNLFERNPLFQEFRDVCCIALKAILEKSPCRINIFLCSVAEVQLKKRQPRFYIYI